MFQMAQITQNKCLKKTGKTTAKTSILHSLRHSHIVV